MDFQKHCSCKSEENLYAFLLSCASINCAGEAGNLAGSLTAMDGTLGSGSGEHGRSLSQGLCCSSLVIGGNGGAHGLHGIAGTGAGCTVPAFVDKTLTMALQS